MRPSSAHETGPDDSRFGVPGQSVNSPEVTMILHVIHAIIVVAIVMSFPCGLAALICKFDDGGSLHKGE